MSYRKMLSVLLLLIFALYFAPRAFADATPGYGYTYTIGGTDIDQGFKSTVDKSSNVYITGFFSGTNVDFNTTGHGSPDLHTSNGYGDIFLTKINADGSYGWTYTMGSGYGEQGDAVATDSNGNVYLTASFNGTGTEFNTTGHGASDTKDSQGNGDVAITKFNADGSYGWTYIFGGTGNEEPADIAVDSANNIYVTGLFSSSNVNFNGTGGGSSDIKSSNGGSDIFLTKINADGSYGYTYTIGGSNGESGYNMAIDSSNNVYFTGVYLSASVDFNTTGHGSADIHTGTTNVASVFLTKIKADGTYGYTRTINPTAGRGYDVAVDSSSNVYFTGQFKGTGIDFNTTGQSSADAKSSNGLFDIFVTKYNADGSYGWTKTAGGSGDDTGLGIGVDAMNNLYVVGTFKSSSMNFNPAGSDSKTRKGGQDMFVTKYNSDASYAWTYTVGANDGTSYVNVEQGVSLDANANLYLAGSFFDSNGSGTNFNPFGGTDTHTVTAGDIYLTKWTGVFTRATNNSGSSNQSIARPGCSDQKPETAPAIFQIDVTKSDATLHINPSAGTYNKFYIAYGTPAGGDEQYGVEFPQQHLDGALTYTIHLLSPQTIYTFKTRTGNGCMPGDWSSTFKIKTTSGTGTKMYTSFNKMK